MEKGPFREVQSSSTSEKIPCNVWKQKDHCHVHNIQYYIHSSLSDS